MIYLILAILILAAVLFIVKRKVKYIEKVVIKEVIKEVPVLSLEEIKGDVVVDGNLLVRGSLKVTKGITCYNVKED